MEMIAVLSDCYYCCTSPMCLCREGKQGMLIFTMQIHKIILLPRGRGYIPLPHPCAALRHALLGFFHHGAPPLSFSGSTPGKVMNSGGGGGGGGGLNSVKQ